MTCIVVKSGLGSMIVCGRGRRAKSHRCPTCGISAQYQCDFPVEGGTCDAWMCARCLHRIADNVDYCPAHFKEHQAMHRLTGIATQYKALADARPGMKLKQKLSHGLMLVFHREGCTYHLALGRDDVYPGDGEVKTCLRDFGAPADTKRVNDAKGEVKIIRLSWPAPDAQIPMQLEREQDLNPALVPSEEVIEAAADAAMPTTIGR